MDAQESFESDSLCTISLDLFPLLALGLDPTLGSLTLELELISLGCLTPDMELARGLTGVASPEAMLATGGPDVSTPVDWGANDRLSLSWGTFLPGLGLNAEVPGILTEHNTNSKQDKQDKQSNQGRATQQDQFQSEVKLLSCSDSVVENTQKSTPM